MTAYLIKRVLVMIPTFVGVTVVIWLVMTLAPGEPQAAQSGGGALEHGPPENLQDLESQDRNVRMFRRQVSLDRPRFWNGWPTLEKSEVREALETKQAGVVGGRAPEDVKAAKRSLDDWGAYAIPSLVALLDETWDDPELQTLTLRYLRQAAYTFRAVRPAGYQPTEEDLEEDRRVDQENALINSPEYIWKPGADRVTRKPVVAQWQAWLDERADRWTYSGWERFKIGITDTQFGKYWSNLLHGDLGLSNRTKEPVVGMILSRLKYSLSLVVPSFLIAWILAVFLGVFSATQHGKATDQGIAFILFMLYSIPTFVMGTILQRWLAVSWGIFPTEGFESSNAIETMTTWEHFLDVLRHIALPMIVYTYGGLAYISRQARSGMLQVLKADFVRTARAKGLSETTVIWKHAVRNGMMPIVTLLGTALPVLLAGSVIIEYIFNIDGFGLLMIKSIFQKDYNVVMGIQIIVAALTLIGLLLTDLIYAAMDPRISYK